MKKKSPPYAIIGAVVLGILGIIAIFHYKSVRDQETADAVQREHDAAAKAIADAQANKPATPIVEVSTDMRPVLYATQPIEPGVLLSPAFFEKKLTPKDILPDSYTDQTDVGGWYAIRKIEKGDPLSPRNVGKSLPYMSQRIPTGMREISLPIFNSDVNNAGGYIVDGDRVDLLYTSRSVDNSTLFKVETVMQNLSVLSVPGSPLKSEQTDGINQVPTPGLPLSVTFLVTPEQAQTLVFISQISNGRFSMILRGRRDNTIEKIKPFQAADYTDGFKKVQRTIDRSYERVKELDAKIQAEEKLNQGQGNTNETSTPSKP